ncbi:SDR family NAD(P)-dependent oxidoreductase [Streptomyces sp. Y7]|uniref:SDR family NAD(P)-dependent oxidoreductase n=1 Tax=Streptomyces sp. Y7 TaxID=3342392 RepID=UPI0037139722
MQGLKGKTAIVTGGGRGIGRAVATRLAAEGVSVAVNYRSDREAAESLVAELTKAGGNAFAIQGDVSDPAASRAVIDQSVAQLGGLDILVSNAGIEHFSSLDDMTPEDFDRVFGTNTRGQLFAAQAAARHLTEGGRIVLTSSVSAHKAVMHHALYAASKAAVESLVLNLALELGPRGITINAVAPGGTRTDMAASARGKYRHPALDITSEVYFKSHIALGRLAEPEEIAAAVAFLVSDDARYVTGRTTQVDGGY